MESALLGCWREGLTGVPQLQREGSCVTGAVSVGRPKWTSQRARDTMIDVPAPTPEGCECHKRQHSHEFHRTPTERPHI